MGSLSLMAMSHPKPLFHIPKTAEGFFLSPFLSLPLKCCIYQNISVFPGSDSTLQWLPVKNKGGAVGQ